MNRGYLVFLLLAALVGAPIFVSAELLVLFARAEEPLDRIAGTYGTSTLSWTDVPCVEPRTCFAALLVQEGEQANEPVSTSSVDNISNADNTLAVLPPPELAPAGNGSPTTLPTYQSSGGGSDNGAVLEPTPPPITAATGAASDTTPYVPPTTADSVLTTQQTPTTTDVLTVDASGAQTNAVFQNQQMDSPPLPAHAALFTKPLSKGMHGVQVFLLQSLLIANGFLKPQYDTGYFGALTYTAVKKFQRFHNLEAIGRVGPKTRALLNAML